MLIILRKKKDVAVVFPAIIINTVFYIILYRKFDNDTEDNP